MYTQIWNKYLPVIKILLKKAKVSNQTLNLNRMDFEKVGILRKAGYKFNIELSKGRLNNVISSVPFARDLAEVLLGDAVVKELLKDSDYQISMNTKYQLSITCSSCQDANANVTKADATAPVTASTD
jgi:hypothetical protein